jgi:hypothetical protein
MLKNLEYLVQVLYQLWFSEGMKDMIENNIH